MATKLARFTAKIFGIGAGTNQMSEFGSLAAATPMRYNGAAISPAIVQALTQYANGWAAAVLAGNSPALEDMNSLCYLFSYQIANILQTGVPEWDNATPYFIGSVVNDGLGNLYISLTNSNSGNALTSVANWKLSSGGLALTAINPATQSPYAMSSADLGRCFLVNSALGAMTFNLPNPASMPKSFSFKVKDIAGNFVNNPCTFHRFGTEFFANLAADYVTYASSGEYQISTDQVNWYIIGR